MSSPEFQPLPAYREYPADEMARRAATFYEDVRRRRSVRDFSDRPVARAANERPFLLLVVGHPAANAQVPAIEKLPLDRIATFID